MSYFARTVPCCLSDRTFFTSKRVVCKLQNRCFQLSSPLSVLFSCVRIVSRYSEIADSCSCGGVAITTVGACLAVFSKAGQAGSSVPACPLNVKQLSKSLPGAYGWLPDFRVFWARFRHQLTHCSHDFRTAALNFNHLFIELTSEHLNFLSRCHRHSISQYRNKSKPQ